MKKSHILETTARHSGRCSICHCHIREGDDIYIRFPGSNELDEKPVFACYWCGRYLDD